MTHYCPSCRQPVANEDRRKRQNAVTPVPGVSLDPPAPNQACRLRCVCGHVVILMKGRK
jgi:hypothetical protein